MVFGNGVKGTEDGSSPDVIALNDVTVEHYSNHLASATFDQLYVRLSDVNGFAIGSQGPADAGVFS